MVIVKGSTSGSRTRFDSMPSTESVVYDDSGAAMSTTGIVSLDSDGFTVGVDAVKTSSINFSAVVYYWIAIGGDSSDIATGTYTGDGTDDRDVVTSLSFQPDYVTVKGVTPANSQMFGVVRSSPLAAATDETWYIDSGGTLTFFANGIQQVLSNGFQVGTHNTVNANGLTYYWYAIKATTGIAEFGTYTGDGAASRDITAVTTFTPDCVVSVRRTAGFTGWKTSVIPSLNGFIASQTSTSLTTTVRGFLADGFSVGTNCNVNAAPYYFMALKENVPSTSSSNFLMFM